MSPVFRRRHFPAFANSLSFALALFVAAFSVASAEQTVTPGRHDDSLGHRCNYSGPGHCPSGFACVNSKCVRRCFFSGNCPEGFFCKSNFICVRKECAAGDTECCANCAEICVDHSECPSDGWGCVLLKCRRVECRARSDCPSNWPCLLGRCYAPNCEKHEECPEGWKCGKKRRCEKGKAEEKAKGKLRTDGK
ncbi:hypothetical protein niasHT_016860 [Heterodera trifolii]|uniref:Uncharacterized protein n=1 Tax=Heterodera trifolii TaxID=157864 RepID=A0ABD2KTE9_9BILA